VFDDRLEHWLHIEGGLADDLEHVGGGGLLLQRLAQLIEQAGVFDGDDSLGGEVLHPLDLLIGESTPLLAVYADSADQQIILEQGNDQKGVRPGELGDSRFGTFHRNVANMQGLLGVDELINWGHARDLWVALLLFGPSRWCVMQRDVPESIAVVQKQVAKAGLANAYRICQHGLEYRFKLAPRA